VRRDVIPNNIPFLQRVSAAGKRVSEGVGGQLRLAGGLITPPYTVYAVPGRAFDVVSSVAPDGGPNSNVVRKETHPWGGQGNHGIRLGAVADTAPACWRFIPRGVELVPMIRATTEQVDAGGIVVGQSYVAVAGGLVTGP
jgi:hypothetical protein